MKKRSCRMTAEEKTVHEFAVKIRKMTDRQIYDFVKESNANSDISELLSMLEEKGIKGVGITTIQKIKDFAVQEGFLNE